MATGAIAGVGTVFQRWDGNVWVTIADINAIVGPSAKRDNIDITSFDTEEGYREFIAGFKDGDEVALNMSFTRDTFEIMVNDFLDDTYQYYQILFPDVDETTIAFEGFVSKLPVELTSDDRIKANIAIKVTGQLEESANPVEESSYDAPSYEESSELVPEESSAIPVESSDMSDIFELILGKFLFLWEGQFDSEDNLLSELSSDDITVMDKDFSTIYIPDESGLAARFNTPDNSNYQEADEDYLWFDSGGTLRDVSVEELYTYDFTQTLVDFNDSSPYNVNAIGILKSGETLTQSELNAVHDYFKLPLFWSGTLNAYGILKANRPPTKAEW